MCGFAGIVTIGPENRSDRPSASRRFGVAEGRHDDRMAGRLDRMSAAIAHRGPDDHVLFDAGFVRLAFRRLSIIDPAGGRQPIVDPGGRVACVMNGEIYDHHEHRARLARAGTPVHGGSDAAILPGLHRLDGPDFARSLDGMFAIAVVDRDQRTVHLIRDGVGIKPLYVARTPQGILFGSEMQSLLASGLIDLELDDEAAACLASFRYAPGTRTIVRGIERVAPGTRVTIHADSGRIECTRWWDAAEIARRGRRNRRVATADLVADLGATLDESVARQIVADVPVGVSVSGGIDSALVAESVARAARARGGPMPTAFTTVFDQGGAEHELAHARALCAQLGLRHVEVPVTATDVGSALDELVAAGDEPCLDPALLPAVTIARAASRDVRVLLSGTGGDELFGGYGHYRPGPHHRLLAALPSALRTRCVTALARRRGAADPRRLDRLEAFASIGLRGHDRRFLQIAGRQVADRRLRRLLFGPAAVTAESTLLHEWSRALDVAGPDDPVAAALRHDFAAYLPDQLLFMLDRSTMTASIEGRVPLLGRDVVAAALAHRSADCVGLRGGLKIPLRRLLARRLPGPLVDAPKRGWHTPVDRWLVEDARGLEHARSVLLDHAATVEPFADRDEVRRLLNARTATITPDSSRIAGAIHALVMLVRWHARAEAIVCGARRGDAASTTTPELRRAA